MNTTTVTPENDRLLTQDELAARWQVTTRTLQTMRKAKKGPKHIFMGKVRYPLSEIIRYEKDQLTEGIIESKIRTPGDLDMKAVREHIGTKKKEEAQ